MGWMAWCMSRAEHRDRQAIHTRHCEAAERAVHRQQASLKINKHTPLTLKMGASGLAMLCKRAVRYQVEQVDPHTPLVTARTVLKGAVYGVGRPAAAANASNCAAERKPPGSASPSPTPLLHSSG
eukprot:363185-Chlamydomonas_euryale.AAC.10